MSDDCFCFIFLFPFDQIWQWLNEVGAVFCSFLVNHNKGSMEDQVDLPP